MADYDWEPYRSPEEMERTSVDHQYWEWKYFEPCIEEGWINRHGKLICEYCRCYVDSYPGGKIQHRQGCRDKTKAPTPVSDAMKRKYHLDQYAEEK
jgi:hypothetical protein